MGFQKRTWLLVLFLLSLVGAIAFEVIQISPTENLYPINMSISNEYGYINQAGQFVVSPQFINEAKEFSEGFAPVKVNKKWGFINLKEQISISPQYDMVGESFSLYDEKPEGDDYNDHSSSFSGGLAGVKLKGKWGFINQSGKLVIPYKFDKVQKFSGGVATVRVGGLWGVINPEGKWIIQPVNKFPIQFFQGITSLNLSLRDKSGWQIIGDPIIYYRDKSGQLVGDFYNPPLLAKEFQEELAIIEIPLRAWQEKRDVYPTVATSEYSAVSKCGFQDKQGKVVIKPQFDGCQSFSQGLAAVRVDKKWGYIDKTGKFVVSPQFDYADSLFEERGLVVSNSKIGFFLGGWYFLNRWYIALCLLVAGLVYMISKPASIFQLVGLVLEKFSPQTALRMYERAIKTDPKSAWSWERKALIIVRVGTLGECIEIIAIWEEAIKLNPHNRFLWRSLILELRLACFFDKSYAQQLIEALERYTESYPKDSWGWGVKALTLDELGRNEEALLAWEKNIKLDPNDRSKWRSQMKGSTLERLRS
ncbi:MAG: WG repeat-containing protein [Nostoc sp.]